jgi:hypothetical protein
MHICKVFGELGAQGGKLMHERRSVYGVGGAAVIAEPLGYRMVWV